MSGFYGHHMIQSVQISLGYALLITFAITGIIVVKHMGHCGRYRKIDHFFGVYDYDRNCNKQSLLSG
jgi:hypothetical protein